MKKVSAIIVAAGEGKRFGGRKQFTLLKGKPVLEWSLEKFNAHKDVDEIILVLPDAEQKERLQSRFQKIIAVVKGGERRQDSVLQGFCQIDPRKTEIILVHDGVRPLVSKNLISQVIAETRVKQAVVPGLPLEDTVKEIAEGETIRTLDRTKLFRIQTPQGFSYFLLKKALQKAVEEKYYGTDEANLVERIGGKLSVIQGDPRNIKVTTLADVKIAEALLED